MPNNKLIEEKTLKRTGGWAKIPNFIIDTGIWAKLNPNAKAVYIVILSHAHYQTGVCSPNRETVAKEAGINVDGFFKARQELEEEGLIQTWRRKINCQWNYKIIKTPEEQREALDKLRSKSIANIGKGGNVRNQSIAYLKDDKGRFIKSDEKVRNESIPPVRNESITNLHRNESITKENIRINTKENSNTGSSSAVFQSQASPVLTEDNLKNSCLAVAEPCEAGVGVISAPESSVEQLLLKTGLFNGSEERVGFKVVALRAERFPSRMLLGWGVAENDIPPILDALNLEVARV
jgi:DNA-binding transcriptional regulator YhcF (GntR family)